ncbi:MAG: enoyl-CoA hydratase/isomerase family protein [Chloroflexi bacterium]|nr:enoyl-CoA hydratase/isomerase family protein [Chloroflexota bacterium]
MDYEDLSLEKKEHIATITLNRPEKLNVLTAKMRQSLLLAVDDIDKDDEIRAVIVTGAGRGFCAGADVDGLARGSDTPAVVSRQSLLKIEHEAEVNVFPRLNKPVIAAVNGACVGIGFGLALSCDIRIASEAAKFRIAQIAMGRIPGGGETCFLPHLIGISRTLELMFTADFINAGEAERLGFVNRVVAPDELMKAAWELASKISQQAPVSLALVKKMVWQPLLEDLAHQLDLASHAQSVAHSTEDAKEGPKAFREKRTPQFKGR